MTDDTTQTETQTQDPPIEESTETTVETPAVSSADVRSHPMFAELREEVVELRKLKSEREDAEQAAADERARKAGEFEKIEEGYKTKLGEMEKAQADLQTARTKDKLEIALMGVGFADKHGIIKKGLLADRLESETPLDDLEAWTAQLTEQYPEHFGQTVSTPQTRAGSPDHGSAAGDDLDKRIASLDQAVRSAAIKEKQALRLAGKLPWKADR